MDKDHLRQRMRAKRNRILPANVNEASQTIFDHIITWPVFQQAHCVGCYVSIQNEVDTHRLIEHALSKGKQVGVPVTQAKGVMDFQRILSWEELRPVRFGLQEPAPNPAQKIAPQHLDLVFVPGIAFDRQGNRLGFGSGFYDRFLQQSSATRVGLAYAFQLVPHIPNEAHDIQMDWVITEEKILLCQTKT